MIEDINRLKELVKKYDRSGPRYTSYPTVPVWSNEYTPDSYLEAIRKAGARRNDVLSLYFHIPFCRKRCWYCGCNTTVGYSDPEVETYLDAIKKEIDLVTAQLGERKNVSQVHFGGGTPTYLTEKQFEGIYSHLKGKLHILEDAEISIELDPRVTTDGQIALMKKLGFNRLSFGVQDFDPEVQEAIGRNQSEELTRSFYRKCRKRGFERINFDFIYGLPKQKVDSFRHTIERAIEFRPDRIALYSYAHLPKTLHHQELIVTGDLPQPEIKFELFYNAVRLFTKAGYVQIGMDHFVLPDDELALAAKNGKLRRNFMGYTVDAAIDWIGLGMSAIGYIDANFAQNVSNVKQYVEVIGKGNPAVFRGIVLTEDDLIRQQVISDIMCNFRIDFAKLKERYGIEFEDYFKEELPQLEGFIADGLMTRKNGTILVTEPGRIFVRNIAMNFDAYLKQDSARKPNAQFSRTI